MSEKPFSAKSVVECQEFSKLIKKNRNKEKIINGCKNTLLSFKFSNNPPQICLLYNCEVYQIWKFRIPNPDSNKGLSSALRLFAYFNKQNLSFYLYKIYQKSEIDKIHDIDIKIKQEIAQLMAIS